MNSCIKTFQALILTCLAAVLLAACGGRREGCTIKGTCTLPGFETAMLKDIDGKMIDRTSLQDGYFTFNIEGKIDTPYICIINLINAETRNDIIQIPVGIENGTVRFNYGADFSIYGTPLNDKVLDFFIALGDLQDKFIGLSPEERKKEASHFYANMVSLNKDNAFGAYIFQYYGSHLLGEDKFAAKKALKKVN